MLMPLYVCPCGDLVTNDHITGLIFACRCARFYMVWHCSSNRSTLYIANGSLTMVADSAGVFVPMDFTQAVNVLSLRTGDIVQAWRVVYRDVAAYLDYSGAASLDWLGRLLLYRSYKPSEDIEEIAAEVLVAGMWRTN